MGVVELIDFDTFPEQGSYLGREVLVFFKYDTTKQITGVCVRDDCEDPHITIFQLEDGRHVLATECQYSPKPIK